MAGYQALYREWRPQAFSDVAGQHHIVQTLQNMLRQGRVYHAFLFCGPRGTGKTTLAKLLAKALNCVDGPTASPCLKCPACLAVRAGSYIDVLEIDGASNRGIDEIRDLRERVKYAPAEGRFKVYIIDEVHMLTTEAFNALLKTLEEPPAHVVFIFATTEVNKVPATIVSRCLRFDFRRLSQGVIYDRLMLICQKVGIDAEAGALRLLAEAANGGMRDALAMLDQVNSYAAERTITTGDVWDVLGLVPNSQYATLLGHLSAGNLSEGLRLLNELVDSGKDPVQINEGLARFCRCCLLFLSDPKLVDAEAHSYYQQAVQQLRADKLVSFIEELLGVEKKMKFTSQPVLLLELALFSFSQALKGAALVRHSSERTSAGESRAMPVAKAADQASNPANLECTQVGKGDAAGILVERESGEIGEEAAKPAKDSPLSLRVIKQGWEGFLSRLMSEDPALSAKLASGQVKSFKGNTLTLQFEKGFSKKFVEQPDNMSIIISELAKEFNASLTVKCLLLDREPDAEPLPKQQPEEAPVAKPQPDDDGIKVALSLFEGLEVDSDMIGGPKHE